MVNTLGTTRKTLNLPAQGSGTHVRVDEMHARVEQLDSIYS
jgi:hypothetical protein